MLCLIIKLTLVFLGVAMFPTEHKFALASEPEKAYLTLALPAQWLIHLNLGFLRDRWLSFYFLYLWLAYWLRLLFNNWLFLNLCSSWLNLLFLLRTSNRNIRKLQRGLRKLDWGHRCFWGTLLRRLRWLRGLCHLSALRAEEIGCFSCVKGLTAFAQATLSLVLFHSVGWGVFSDLKIIIV